MQSTFPCNPRNTIKCMFQNNVRTILENNLFLPSLCIFCAPSSVPLVLLTVPQWCWFLLPAHVRGPLLTQVTKAEKMNVYRHARGTSNPISRSSSPGQLHLPLPHRRWLEAGKKKDSIVLSRELGKKNLRVCKRYM